jgi:hypothetical protein
MYCARMATDSIKILSRPCHKPQIFPASNKFALRQRENLLRRVSLAENDSGLSDWFAHWSTRAAFFGSFDLGERK